MPLSAQSAINMHLGIGGIITKLGIEKRRNVKHAFKFMTPMVWLTRLLVGAYPQWIGCKPEKIQRIYFANHSSHLDTIVIWSALPRSLRPLTRPVAARDYWQSGIRRRIAVDELNVVLVDRRRVGVSAINSRRAKNEANAKKMRSAASPRQKAIAKTISRGQEARTRELTTRRLLSRVSFPWARETSQLPIIVPMAERTIRTPRIVK